MFVVHFIEYPRPDAVDTYPIPRPPMGGDLGPQYALIRFSKIMKGMGVSNVVHPLYITTKDAEGGELVHAVHVDEEGCWSVVEHCR